MWHALTVFVDSIHFTQPGWLWSLPLTLLGAGLLLHRQRLLPLTQLPAWRWQRLYRHPRHAELQRQSAELSAASTGSVWRHWLQYALVLLCLQLALAGPYRQGQQLPTPPEYRDTLFIIDTSIDMALTDYRVDGQRTSRMRIVKDVLTHFIDHLQGNRIGLIIFSEQAFTLTPLTADYGLLKSMVQQLKPAVLTGQTSNLGKALLYTLKQLQPGHRNNPGSRPTLVLISGANWTYRDIDPRAVAAYLHRLGYRLYSIGVGAPGYSEPSPDSAGMVYQPPDFRLLKAIAHRGGGRFFWATDTRSLQAAIKAIQSAERHKTNLAPRYIRVSLYQWPLLAGLLGLLMLQAWPPRRRRT